MDEQATIRRYAHTGWLKLKDDEAVDAFVAISTHTSHEGCEEYANYWKLLIDRKMVNHKTGKVIAQKAVLPNIDTAGQPALRSYIYMSIRKRPARFCLAG